MWFPNVAEMVGGGGLLQRESPGKCEFSRHAYLKGWRAITHISVANPQLNDFFDLFDFEIFYLLLHV